MYFPNKIQKEITRTLQSKKILVKRKAIGKIHHDYLVPGGPYEEHWDWDGFFIGISLSSDIPSEAIYLKNWCLNYLEATASDGFTPGLLTARGTDKRLKHIKPFLAQGAYFASQFLNDFSWIRPWWPRLKKSIAYREHAYFDDQRGLACWHNSMESGADNNIAALDFPDGTVIATDLNAFIYREYLALAKIAERIGYKNEAKRFQKKALAIKKAMMKYLWDPHAKAFFNIDRRNGRLIRHITYSGIIPLWAGIASKKNGREMIRRHLLNPKKMWARHGIRTLSRDDPAYNQTNMIKPHSNWQGPVWPLVNSLTTYILIDYGFAEEARHLAATTIRLCLADIRKTGGMHENYNAETGQPLAAPNFVSWNLLVEHLITQTRDGTNPFQI